MVRNWFQRQDQIIRLSCRYYYDLMTATGESHMFWREMTASKGKRATCPSCTCLDNSAWINFSYLLVYACVPWQVGASLSSLSIPRGRAMGNLCSSTWRRSGGTGCAPSGRASSSGDQCNYVHVWKKPPPLPALLGYWPNYLALVVLRWGGGGLLLRRG